MGVGFTLINGHRHDFSSCEITIDGIPYTGVKDIAWNHGLEPTAVRGNAPGKTGRTRGVYDADGKITLYAAEAQLLLVQLEAKGLPLQQGFMETAFLVSISRYEPFAPAMTALLHGCRIKKVDNSASEGGDALATSFDLDIMRITENGFEPHRKALVK